MTRNASTSPSGSATRSSDAARAGDLPAGYGRQLVHAARTENERAGGMGDGGLALSFLFHGRDLPGAIVIEAIDEAIRQEHAFAARLGGGPDIGAVVWQGTGTNAARGLWLDFDEPYRGDDLDAVDAQDPMYALLGQLARERNGDAGREVFADADRARYLFAERDVLADGGRAIVAAAATAAAGRDVVATAATRLLDDASLVASAFVNLFGPAHADDVGEDERATAGAARIVGVHMYGVQHAMGLDSTVTDGDRIGALPDDRPRARDRRPVGRRRSPSSPTPRSPRAGRAAVFDPVGARPHPPPRGAHRRRHRGPARRALGVPAGGRGRGGRPRGERRDPDRRARRAPRRGDG